jgi:flagellar biogenesis protein FliO
MAKQSENSYRKSKSKERQASTMGENKLENDYWTFGQVIAATVFIGFGIWGIVKIVGYYEYTHPKYDKKEDELQDIGAC